MKGRLRAPFFIGGKKIMRAMPALLLALFIPLAHAQQQVVRPPIAQYWMSVETAAGMSMPGMSGMGGIMGSMMGGPAQGGRRMLLQLGSQQAASGTPRADHAIPPGMNMGPALPLLTPERAKPERGGETAPYEREKPKGRMLIYWGCGDSVRAGQPVIIDFAKIADGQTPPNMVSHRVNAPRPPRGKTYGEWPNQEDSKAVPDSASLRGDHNVKGNYSPEIKFALGETHDFMQRVELTNSGNKMSWNAVPNATGYFALLYGGSGQEEVVFWSSSEVQEMGGMLMDHVPPAEVARLVKEKIVMPPSTTECAVPGEVVQRAGGSPFVNFVAYGPEANFVHPPRPSDPKVPWNQEWTAKARFKSTASLILGEGGRTSRGTASRETQPRQEPADKPAADNPVDQGIKALRGIFGR